MPWSRVCVPSATYPAILDKFSDGRSSDVDKFAETFETSTQRRKCSYKHNYVESPRTMLKARRRSIKCLKAYFEIASYSVLSFQSFHTLFLAIAKVLHSENCFKCMSRPWQLNMYLSATRDAIIARIIRHNCKYYKNLLKVCRIIDEQNIITFIRINFFRNVLYWAFNEISWLMTIVLLFVVWIHFFNLSPSRDVVGRQRKRRRKELLMKRHWNKFFSLSLNVHTENIYCTSLLIISLSLDFNGTENN